MPPALIPLPQVAMLCMDPYYRTLPGLLLLIQKDAGLGRRDVKTFDDVR